MMMPTKSMGRRHRSDDRSSLPRIHVLETTAFAILIFLMMIVILFLMVVMGYTSHSGSIGELQKDIKFITDTAAKTVNYTEELKRSMPPLNFTHIVQNSIDDNEEAWIEAVASAKRTAGNFGNLIRTIDESHTITRYSDLAEAVTKLFTSPKVAHGFEVFSDEAVNLLNHIKSEKGQSSINKIKNAIVSVAETLQSPEAKDIAREFVRMDETKQLVASVGDTVGEISKTFHVVRSLISDVKEEQIMRRFGEFMDQLAEEGIIEKIARVYNKAEHIEHKVWKFAKTGYSILEGLLEQEGFIELPAHHNQEYITVSN
jgi:hypothetical protein